MIATPTSNFTLLLGVIFLYKTIKNCSFAEFTEKKSRFLSYASHVSTEDDAVNFIKTIKNKHKDATHNVYAYILKTNNLQKYSDAGEPRGTAGVPILNILIKSQLYDVAVVVTRYFGGTLLGTGGLVRAYSNGCKLAIQNATIVSVHLCQKIYLCFDYNLYSKIKNLLQNYHYKILKTVYNNNIILELAIHYSSFNNFYKEILELTGGKIIIKKLDKLEMSLT